MAFAWLFFVFILAWALVRILQSARPLGRRFVLFTVIPGAVALLAAAVWARALSRKAQAELEFARSLPRTGRPGGYVTSDQCRSCHPSQYESWHQSFHRRMTQAATPENVVADFHNARVQWQGRSYELKRRGEEFLMCRLESGGGAVGLGGAPESQERLGMVTGSHHMQVFWVPTHTGNSQFNFPLAYLLADQRWVPFQETFLHDPQAPQPPLPWHGSCVLCHAVAGQPREDPRSGRADTQVGELGIACESCHGPGERHVAANLSPWRRYRLHRTGEPDPTIVNPRRLPPKLASQVCGQCHSIKWAPDTGEVNLAGYPYRPGDDLDRTVTVIRPAKLATQPWLRRPLEAHPDFVRERYWNDGVARISGRDYSSMIESKCYQRGQLSCLSCHSMHESSPTNQLAAHMDGNEACLTCHEKFRGKAAEHSHHPAGSSGDLCYNCHMPYTTYGLLKGIRSHYIESPDAAKTRATGRPNACNLCHLDRTLAWTSEYLSRWYGQAPAILTGEDKTYSSAVLYALKGDAGQRALAAWSMGWRPAQLASGGDWTVPFLAQLLVDPYAAVRYIAARSLRQTPGSPAFDYDFVGPPDEREKAALQVTAAWSRSFPAKTNCIGAQILISADGRLASDQFAQLLRGRDDRPVNLRE